MVGTVTSMTHRLTWTDLPASLHRRLEDLIGAPVASTRSCSGGFSTSTAEIVRSTSGRKVFVKAVREQDNPGTMQLNRTEAAALARVPSDAPVPALLTSFTHEDWFVLVTEVAPGALPAQPWTGDQLDAVLAALDELQTTSTPCLVPGLPSLSESLGEDMCGFERVARHPPTDLDPWIAERLDLLRESARRGIEALDGDTLCHSDLRADNIVITDGGEVSLVDWAWASRGSRVADALQLLSSVDDPDGRLEVDARIDALLDLHSLPSTLGTDVITGIFAFFVDVARRPYDPSLPLLGEHRRRRRDSLRGLVVARWER